jgi:crotonobetainyl-CoA:carnitine CoA-transferase CaiB-like acyl-CoA transferase
MVQPLEGIRVLELATDVAGPFAAKLLADFGADVIKVEPPGGDPARRHGPFPDACPNGPDPEQSALFLYLNANKRGLVADLAHPADRTLIADLAAASDLVIESHAPGVLAGAGLGYHDLCRRNPATVVTSITPFGQTGPYAHYKGADIVTYAMGGPMYGTGVDDREPTKLGGNLTSYQCGNLAATASLAAVTMAQHSGAGVHIDLSMFEAQAGSVDRRVTYLLWYLWSGMVVGRQPANSLRTLPNGFFPTAEGHVLTFTLIPWIPRMLDVLDDAGLRQRFANPDWIHDDDLPDEIQAVLLPWLFEGDKSDRAAAAQAHKWSMTALNAPIDVLDDPHFVDRGYFVETDHPVAGRYRQPGAPFRLGDDWQDAWRLRRPAPTLDQHGPEIRAEVEAGRRAPGAAPPGPPATPPASPAPPPAATRPQRLPLEGIRVLDLTVVWAGPSCTMHLADLGAEVIRVDNPYVFPPATRGNAPRPDPDLLVDFGPLGGGYPNLDTSGRPWNKHGMWSAQARNKLSCTLDIRTDLGLETFFRLVEVSDVLVENNSVATLDKLGLGWDRLHARNPNLIALRMPPMSLSGPYASYVGFGASFEALCGLTRIRGYLDDDPTTTSAAFHMDPTTGASGAFAVMCALRRRAANGHGELIEFAQSENMMQHIGEYFVDAARTGRHHGPGGNRHLSRAPQGCYRCEGDDRWVVISVGTDEEWAALASVMGRADLADESRFATAAGRMANHDELDELIGAWTATVDHRAVFERCQAAGVPAGPVLDEADAYADPHLAARRFFRPQGSEDVGTWSFPGHQWRWTGPDMRWGPICRLGADNDHVLRHVLGLSDDEYQALDDAGHLSLDYLQPDGTPW